MKRPEDGIRRFWEYEPEDWRAGEGAFFDGGESGESCGRHREVVMLSVGGDEESTMAN